MIVPMKKVSLIIMGDKKSETLTKLRKMGVMHIEIAEGNGGRISELKEKISMIENSIFSIEEKVKKNKEVKDATNEQAMTAAKEVFALAEEKKSFQSEQISLKSEIDRIKNWGDFEPEMVNYLVSKGVDIAFYEIPKAEYEALDENVKTIRLEETKTSVKCIVIYAGTEEEAEFIQPLNNYRLELPKMSISAMQNRIEELDGCINSIDEKIVSYAGYVAAMKNVVKACEKEIEFEVYATGMADESLVSDGENNLSVAHFKGYIEADNVELLKQEAKNNSWGLVIEEPTEEDNVPTKLKNNKFVSLIYPLTDFLNTIPGYYEYDISAWFLAFIFPCNAWWRQERLQCQGDGLCRGCGYSCSKKRCYVQTRARGIL